MSFINILYNNYVQFFLYRLSVTLYKQIISNSKWQSADRGRGAFTGYALRQSADAISIILIPTAAETSIGTPTRMHDEERINTAVSSKLLLAVDDRRR